MDLDRKFSQGIPIGNDISFLLGEIVLAAVDKELKCDAERSFRYFDDYEFACSTEHEALQLRESLESELAKFRLRLNPKKTEILRLPIPAQDEWQDVLLSASRSGFKTERHLIRFFDAAFRLRETHTQAPVLSFALGTLFKIQRPNKSMGRVAESAITQVLLCESGSCQKAFSLLSFWILNGYQIDKRLFGAAISQLVTRSLNKGTHDLIWALSFCLGNGIHLDKSASSKLKDVENDIIAILALHMQRKRLLAKTFDRRSLAQRMRQSEPDREHWLLCYEAARHNLLTSTSGQVKVHSLFSAMLKAGVSFYKTSAPAHFFVMAQGGAPDWLIRSWCKRVKSAQAGGRIAKNKSNQIESALQENDGSKISLSDFKLLLSLPESTKEPAPDKEAVVSGV